MVGQIDVTNITRAVDCCPHKRKERRQRGQTTDAKSTRYQYWLSCPYKRLSNLVFVLKVVRPPAEPVLWLGKSTSPTSRVPLTDAPRTARNAVKGGKRSTTKSTRYQFRLSCPCKRLLNLVFVLKADGYLLRVSALERLRCCSIVCTYFITVRKERRRMTESNDRTRR